MSVLEQFTQQTEQQPQDYQFAAGDLSFIDEMEQPKQPMNISERPDFDTFDPTDPTGNLDTIEDDGQHDELIAAAVEETANLITDTIDNGAAFGLSLISKNPIDSHKATDEQKGRMRKIIYVYCEKTGGYIPLWLQLIILIIGIYGVQIPAAMQARQINILEEKVREQERKLKAYELEKQSQTLRQELQDRQREDKQE